MGKKTNHDVNRVKVCGVCGFKISFGTRRPIAKFKISEEFKKLIQKYSNDEFDLKDVRFPTSVCSTCIREKGNNER